MILGKKPEPGRDKVARRQIGAQRDHQQAEADEKGARDMIGAQSHKESLTVSTKLEPGCAGLRRWQMSSLHAANSVDGVFLAFGVGGPERREFGLVHIRQFLAEIFERVEELLAVRGLVQSLAQRR